MAQGVWTVVTDFPLDDVKQRTMPVAAATIRG